MFETCEKTHKNIAQDICFDVLLSIFPSEYQGNDIRKIRPRYIHIT